MSYSPKPRLAVDLDEIAHQLNEPRPAPVQPAASAGRGDPLAELARIVGQDDPYGKILGPAPAGNVLQMGRHDVQFPPAPPSDEQDEAAYAPYYADEAYDDTYPSEDHEDLVPLEPRRSRKGLAAVVGVLGVAVVGVGGALIFGAGGGFAPTGEPPLIAAAEGPVKVQPQAPGGVEIPNQNKQIYERAAADTQTRVVNREEQPVDVRQAVRGATTNPELAANQPAQPPGQNALASTLGEPRRVRTVSIRPDGSVISDAVPAPAAPSPSPSPAASGPDSAPPRNVLPTLTLPPAAATPAPRPALPAAATPAPVAAPSAPLGSAPAATPAATTQARPATPAPATPTAVAPPSAPATTTPPQGSATPAPARVAAASPNAPMPITPTAIAPQSASTPAAAAAGGWAVQLGVRPSESEARAAFAQFQAKHPELKGEAPIIRQAEVNGSTIYRVRVGPLSKDDASALCSKLQGAGGQCFVAKN